MSSKFTGFIALIFAAAIAVGCQTSSSDDNAAATDIPTEASPSTEVETPTEAPASEAPAREAVTITGSGTLKSAPFALAGSYTVSWSAKAGSDVGCYHGTDLERVDGQLMLETLTNEIIDDAEEHTGSSAVYNLEALDYYINANSGCDTWSFVFTPIN